jgi:dsRNA-specific ribonuclease
MELLPLPTTYSPLSLIGNISDHHNIYKRMNQWILSLLRPQLQMETVRTFPRNLEEYLNSTNKKSLTYLSTIWRFG